MSSRFGHREARSSLFSAYDTAQGQSRTKSQSPFRSGAGGGAAAAPNGSAVPPSNTFVGAGDERSSSNPAFGAYPTGRGPGAGDGGFRAATPNKKGQYSDAVLSELESQNDEQLQGMSAKVRMLKDITVAIGDEIRDSTAFAETMNNSFENARVRLRGTMNRMLRMAERTGVGWKVWLAFFAAVIFLFWFVWLGGR